MKRIAVALALISAPLVQAQTPDTTTPTPTVTMMHISSIHQATEAEKTYHTAFGQQFIETTIGNLHYTLEGLTGWAGCNVEVGKDYEVVKTSQKEVTIKCPVGKKGKTFNAGLNVTNVAEITETK